MTDTVSKSGYEKWAKEIAAAINISTHDEGVAEMTTKKIKIAQTTNTGVAKKNSLFWQHKTAEELAEEQGVIPIRDEADFIRRFVGGGEDWDDIDEFLKEVHRPLK